MLKRMNRRTFVQLASSTALTPALPALAQTEAPDAVGADHLLWFSKPAEQWLNALPIGNGTLAGMVFGGDEQGDGACELLQLNEATLWSGKPRNGNNPHAKDYLSAVRDAVLKEQDYHLADALCKKMQGKHIEAYQPLANVRLISQHTAPLRGYRRELDLDKACAKVSYVVGGARFTREMFCSAPHRVLVVRMTASSHAGLSCSISLDAELQRGLIVEGDSLVLTGKAPAHFTAPNHPGGDHPLLFSDQPGEGMYYAVAMRVLHDGGSIRQRGNAIGIESANALTLLLSAATGYRGFQRAPDTAPEILCARAKETVNAAAQITYDKLLLHHLADHRKFYRRMSLSLGGSDAATLPTDQRLTAFHAKADNSLAALYVHFGRYLLITSSRPGSQPANLQGIWNGKTVPPWGSNLTSNIDFQMNYWPSETCNLTECGEPLFDLIGDLTISGARTASESYGLPGWCAHHNIDLWRSANSAGEGTGPPTWGNWCMAGPWLSAHLYEHYLFTQDKEFLSDRGYPAMRGAAEFCLAWMIEDNHGHLTTCPSESTENDFLAPDGQRAMTSAGCTMDMALIRELFSNCIAAAGVLGVDQEFSGRLKAARQRLLPYRIGSYGQLQEWSVDFKESTPGQRHLSHLYPMFPGSEITVRETPELAKAVSVSLDRRLAAGGGYTGWSRAWAISLWARLGEGDRAWESIQRLMSDSTNSNLLDLHPDGDSSVFLIDGNLGATAAVAEMLLQSHTGKLVLLPALPTAWAAGSVKGLRARGGITVDMRWSQNRLESCTLRADRDTSVQVRTQTGLRLVSVKAGAAAVMLSGASALTPMKLKRAQKTILRFAKVT